MRLRVGRERHLDLSLRRCTQLATAREDEIVIPPSRVRKVPLVALLLQPVSNGSCFAALHNVKVMSARFPPDNLDPNVAWQVCHTEP